MRPRFLIHVSLLLAAFAPSLSAQKPAPAAPEFGDVVDVNVVNVDVYVTDKNGNPVTGLEKGDFKLYVDGKRVDITNFEAVDRTSAPAAAPAGAPAPAPAPSETPDASAESPLEDSLRLVVYIDNFNIRMGNRARALKQLREFLTRELAPGDQVTIVSYDLGLHVRLPFTSDPAAIDAAIDGLSRLTVQGDEDDRSRRQAFQEIMTIQEASIKDMPPLPCPRRIATPAHGYASARRQEVLKTFSALTLLVNSLSGLPGRKAVLHVSDGISITPGEELFQFLFQICGGGGATGGMGSAQIPNRPPVRERPGLQDDDDEDDMEQQIDDPNAVFDSRLLGPAAYPAASQAALDAQGYSVAANVATLAAHANAHRVTLYTLQTDGAQATVAADASFGPNERLLQIPAVARVERSNRQETLTALASATGGRAFLDSVDLRPDLARLREDFDRYYSLAYSPSRPGDGKEHRIEVKVKGKGLTVRSRQSYRDKPALERTVDRTLAALLYDFEDNPLGVSVEIGEQTAQGGRYMVPVYLRVPLFKLRILENQGEDGETSYEGKLRLFVATRGAGGLTPIRQVDVPIQIPRKEVLMAMGQYYGYTLSLDMAPGEQQIAVAVRDELTTTTSYLNRSVDVGAEAATTALQTP